MTDQHLHTIFSPDGSSPMEEYCKHAEKTGCSALTFCDHLDIGYPDPKFESSIDPAAYIESFSQCRSAHPSLQLGLGIEAGYVPDASLRTAMFLTMLPLDFVINSVHVVQGLDPYFPEYFSEKTREQAYQAYLEAVFDSLDAPYDFSVLGHITYVSRSAPYLSPAIQWREFPDLLDAILMRTIYLGKGLELNTSSLKRIDTPMPSAGILRRYRELGGEIVTIGSDAHNSNRLCADFDRATDILADCGFRYYALFQNMQPVMLSLK